MSEEEREKLCERLRKNGYDMDAKHQAADEIERLSKRIEELEKELAVMETDLNLAVYTD